MANINHVNNYFWIKIFLVPILLPYFIIYFIIYLINVIRYLSNNKEINVLDRYKKFSSFYSNYLFFVNNSYYFVNEKNINKKANLFICNSALKWSYVFIAIHLFKNNSVFATFNVNKKNRKIWQYFLRILDVFEKTEDYNFFFKNQRSLFYFYKSDNTEDLKKLLEVNDLNIVLVKISKSNKFLGRKVYFDFFKVIKTHEFLNLSTPILLNRIHNLLIDK